MICIDPIFVRKTGIHVRCGKCLPCRESRQKEWAVRLSEEFKQCFTAYFVTLTFNEEALSKYPKLDKDVFQRFLKRLRQYTERGLPNGYENKKVSKINGKGQNLSYFAVGELGTLNNRPHWHLLLFNFPFNQEDAELVIDYAWREDGKSLGFDYVGIIQQGAIEYTTDYLFKNEFKDSIRLISKGIGSSYATDENIHYHQKKMDGLMIVNHVKRSMPRYYSKKLFNENQRKEIGLKKADFILESNLEDPQSVERQYIKLKLKVENKKRKRL